MSTTGTGSFFWNWMVVSILFLTLIYNTFYAYHRVREQHRVPHKTRA
jgi:hypothetical protein